MTEENNRRLLGRVNLSIGLNIVLAIALIGLYIFHFNSAESVKPAQMKAQRTFSSAEGEGMRVAFVNTDVLLERYEMVKQMASDFEKEQRKRDSDLQKRTREYEEEAAYFQQSVKNQSLSEASAQQIYDQLMGKQQELYDLQQRYSAELGQQEYEMTSVLLDTVKNYLNRINIERKYDYIFNNSVASPVLLSNDTLDITDAVLKGLNEEYNKLYNPEDE